MATMKDVAEMAGVSITTVSHVINKSRFVSEEVINKVNEAIDKLNYKPNIVAQSLRKKKTYTIGGIFSANLNPYFAEVIIAIENSCFNNDYNIILCHSSGDYRKEINFLDVLVQRGVDGIILDSIICDFNKAVDTIHNIEIPVILMNRELPGLDKDVIIVDDFIGGYDAAKYLVDNGHKRIAFVTGKAPPFHVVHQRILGSRKAFDENGLKIDYDLVFLSDFSFQGGYNSMMEILKIKSKPTAVFFHNDVMAIGAISAANDKGIKIPDDISILGYDDIEVSSFTIPRLTSVAPPKMKLGEKIVKLLLNRINDENIPLQKEILKPKLVIRDSCISIK